MLTIRSLRRYGLWQLMPAEDPAGVAAVAAAADIAISLADIRSHHARKAIKPGRHAGGRRSRPLVRPPPPARRHLPRPAESSIRLRRRRSAIVTDVSQYSRTTFQPPSHHHTAVQIFRSTRSPRRCVESDNFATLCSYQFIIGGTHRHYTRRCWLMLDRCRRHRLRNNRYRRMGRAK